MPFEWGKKQEFTNGERIIIYNIGHDREYSGIVRGKSFEHYIDSYIIELDKESKQSLKNGDGTPYRWDCISITEACLKRVDDPTVPYRLLPILQKNALPVG